MSYIVLMRVKGCYPMTHTRLASLLWRMRHWGHDINRNQHALFYHHLRVTRNH
jgi:hypothetical protein